MENSFSSCFLCSSDVHQEMCNNQINRIILDIFPNLILPSNVMTCHVCCSTLDLYSNIKSYLANEQENFLDKEFNEHNIADFIMWCNDDTNEDKKCNICLKISQDVEEDSEKLVSLVFSDLDARFYANIVICKKCKQVLENLNNFKIKCQGVTKKIEEDRINYCYINESDSVLSSDGINSTSVCSESDKDNYRLIVVQSEEKEIKSFKRNGVHLYNCPKCNVVVLDIQKHIKGHTELHLSIRYICERCNLRYDSLSDIKSHDCKDFSSCEEYKSDICVNTNSGHNSHLMISNVSIWKCEQCTFQTKQKGNLKTHYLTHKNPDEIHMYKCNLCKFQSRQKGNLKTHKLVHKSKEDIKTYKCSHCFYQARQKGNLHTHILKKHKTIDKNELDNILHLKCKLCSFTSKQKRALREHIEKHHK